MAARKETRSIADFVSDVAYRKRRVAEVRFAGPKSAAENPREVYLAACATIGEYLEEEYGFKYAKSGPHARRRSGDFTFQISFQSSHWNIAGEHVCLCIYGNVESSRIKKWRAVLPILGSSWKYVAGGQIGNLRPDHSWLEWDLANAAQRNEVIRDAINAIEELAFPYFAKFKDVPSLIQSLLHTDVPSMEIDRTLEFLMCFADQAKARDAGANFLQRRPDLVRAYRRDYARYAERGLDQVAPSGYAKQLAFASHAFRLGELA